MLGMDAVRRSRSEEAVEPRTSQRVERAAEECNSPKGEGEQTDERADEAWHDAVLAAVNAKIGEAHYCATQAAARRAPGNGEVERPEHREHEGHASDQPRRYRIENSTQQ